MESSKVAFIVGIGNYRYCGELKYCPPSAREVYNWLTHPQYGCFDQRRSILLLGEEQEIMTVEKLEKNIRNTINKLSVEDEFLFFFCGHGKVSYSNELILPMSNYSEEESLNVYYFDNILKLLKEKSITKAVMIIDACRSEAMLASMKNYQDKDIKFAWSCSKDEYSYQFDKVKRTYFSYYFCKGIEGWAEKEDMKLSQLIRYINRNTEEEKVEQKAELYGSITGADMSISKGRKKYPDIPFSNRKQEIESVLRGHNEDRLTCQIIDAPAGYGKTVLLKKIKESLEEKGGCCILTTVESEYSEDMFVKDILFRLNSASELENKNRKQYIVNIINEIEIILSKNSRAKDFTFSFLIDFNDKPCSRVVEYISGEFMHKIVARFNYSKKIKFIMSARCLSLNINEFSRRNIKICSGNIVLSPFSYDITKNALIDFFKSEGKVDVNEEIVSMSAACLMFFSGGHPGCIASILEEQNKDISVSRDPNSFITNRDDMYKRHFTPVVNDIIDSFDIEKRELIERFSVFRSADSKMIMKFFNFKNIIERDNFIDYLLRTYLFRKDGYRYHDNIVRNVIAINFQKEKLDSFLRSCRYAQQICLDRIKEVQYSECWVAEYLFQIFQEFSARYDDVEDSDKRSEFREKLMEYIHLVLKRYTEKDSDDQDDSVLQKFIEDDHELRFIANYSLRKEDEIYNEEPFDEIKKEIAMFFSRRKGEEE